MSRHPEHLGQFPNQVSIGYGSDTCSTFVTRLGENLELSQTSRVLSV